MARPRRPNDGPAMAIADLMDTVRLCVRLGIGVPWVRVASLGDDHDPRMEQLADAFGDAADAVGDGSDLARWDARRVLRRELARLERYWRWEDDARAHRRNLAMAWPRYEGPWDKRDAGPVPMHSARSKRERWFSEAMHRFHRPHVQREDRIERIEAREDRRVRRLMRRGMPAAEIDADIKAWRTKLERRLGRKAKRKKKR